MTQLMKISNFSNSVDGQEVFIYIIYKEQLFIAFTTFFFYIYKMHSEMIITKIYRLNLSQVMDWKSGFTTLLIFRKGRLMK